MNILVTGGLGYIASHTVVELINSNHQVILVDNMYNSNILVLDSLGKITCKDITFHQIDVSNEKQLENLFHTYKFDGVIHFAGYKAVGESVAKPLDYYYNNLLSTILLAQLCQKYNVGKFVFSSSATVYGDQPSPLMETMGQGETINPYGESKAMCERILTDAAKANPDLAVSILRYFNPIGAHPSGLIGELPNGIPNNLMPYITKVARGELDKLSIYGNDYDTLDGTGVRDYVHVVDLARGHVHAIENIKSGVNVYNLGTGSGTSVLQLVKAFIETTGVDIPYEIGERRPGDVAVSYADVSKARQELGWVAKHSIEDMVRDAWNFEQLQASRK